MNGDDPVGRLGGDEGILVGEAGRHLDPNIGGARLDAGRAVGLLPAHQDALQGPRSRIPAARAEVEPLSARRRALVAIFQNHRRPGKAGGGLEAGHGVHQPLLVVQLEMEVGAGGVAAVADIADELPRPHLVARPQVRGEHKVAASLSVICSRSVVIQVSAQAPQPAGIGDPKRLHLHVDPARKRGQNRGHLGRGNVLAGVAVIPPQVVVIRPPHPASHHRKDDAELRAARRQGLGAERRNRGRQGGRRLGHGRARRGQNQSGKD